MRGTAVPTGSVKTSQRDPLVMAAYKGDTSKLVELISSYGSNALEYINRQDQNGNAALYFCARNGHIDALRILLESKASPNICNSRHNTALHVACAQLHYSIVRMLLQNGAAYNLQNLAGKFCFQTPQKHRDRDRMEQAVKHITNNLNLKAELERAALINKTQSKRSTGDSVDTGGKNIDFKKMVEVLQNMKVDARPMFLNLPDASGSTAMHRAMMQNEEPLVRLFLDFGGDPDVRDDTNETPLHIACLSRNKELIALLMQRGANRFLRNTNDRLCHELIQGSREQQDILSFLVAQEKLRENLKSISITMNGDGDTSRKALVSSTNALVTAVRMADAALTERELPRNMDILNIPVADCRGKTILFLAVQTGDSKIVKVLLDHKADIAMVDEDGNTALHTACAVQVCVCG
jgi:ankyrin repeat protein